MATIQGVYLALFGRPADPLGLSFFNAATNNGQNLAGIGPLQSSAEFQNRFAGQTNTQIITAIYQSLFNRDPDLAGLTFFTNALTNGTLSINNIAIAIYDGAQGADKTIRDLKEAAANAFTAAVDTVAEINGYTGDAAAASARAFIAGVTTTAPTADQVNAAVAGAVAVGGPAPTTLTLTTGPDALTGKGGSDIFVASETTLSSADVLDGAGGIDTLRYASSGNADVLESGFAMKDIERISVTSDLTPGNFTKFDLTGATGVTTVINDNSSVTASFTGVQNIVAAELTNVSGGNTFIVYKDSVVAGTADAMSVTLKGNATNAGGFIGDLNIGNATSGGFAGLETLNVTSIGSASKLNDITTGAKTINVSGDANLSVASNLEGATLIDASGFKGALSVVADSGALDVVVKGGTGNDTANFSNGFAAGDAFNGGDGTDTLGLTNVIATGALGGTTTSVEQLNVTTPGGGTLDASKFAGVTKITYDDGLGGATTITKGTTGQTIEVDVNPGANQNLTYKLATNGTADVTTIELDDIKAPGSQVGAISARDAETLNISFDDDSTDGKATLTVANVTFGDAKSLVLSGDAETTIASFTFDPLVVGTKSALTTVDASGLTDHLKVTGLGGVLAEAGATIKLGTGNDSITNGTGLGADSVTLGAGKDTLSYTALNQSAGAKIDTIQDFKQGEDILDVSQVNTGFGVIDEAKDFVGNFANFGAAQGAIKAFDGNVEAVFQVDTNTLWVDLNDDGTLNADDLQIVLKGVTALTAADLGFVAGNNITLTAPAANVDLTTKVNSDGFTTKGDDTINSTVANLAGSAVNGAAGTDTLNVTDGGVAGGLGGFTSVETLVLNAATTIDATTAPNITKVVGSAKADIVTTNANQTNVALGDGDDTLNLSGTLLGANTVDGGAASDILATANGTNISAGTVKGFEVLNATGNLVLTVAQQAAFLGINGIGANTFFLTDSGTFTGNATVEAYQLAGGDDIFTLGTSTQNVNDTGGTNTINYNLGGNYTGTLSHGGNTTFATALSTNVTGATFFTTPTTWAPGGGTTLTINASQVGNVDVIGGGNATLQVIENGSNLFINKLSGVSVLDTTSLLDNRVVDIDDTLVGQDVTIQLGVADLTLSQTNTNDAYTVIATGGVATQEISTVGAAGRTTGVDFIIVNGAATHNIDTGRGDDFITFAAGGGLTSADVVNGGNGSDALNINQLTAATDINGVINVEVFNFLNTGGVNVITPGNSVIAAGASATFNFSSSGSTANFSGETDGRVTVVLGGGTNTVTFTGNNLADSYTAAGGNDAFNLGANNTIANLANVDTITNFGAAGLDTINVTTAAVAGRVFTLNVATAELGTFVGNANAAIALLPGYVAAAADLFIINVAGGSLAGTYAVSDDAGNGINGTDQVVKLVGAGILTEANFI